MHIEYMYMHVVHRKYVLSPPSLPLSPLSPSPSQDEPLTAADSKKLADSLDLDDMDANLFGSFSQSQSHKRRRSSSKKSSLPSSKPAPEGSTKQRETVTAEPKLRVADSGKEDKMVSTLKDLEKTSEATSVLKASQKPKPIKTLSELGFIIKKIIIVKFGISSLFQRILMTFLTFSQTARTRTWLPRRGKNQKSS